MIKELSFDDDDGFYPIDNLTEDEEPIVEDKIPRGKLAKIIDEYETVKDDYDDGADVGVDVDVDDDDDITMDSLGLR